MAAQKLGDPLIRPKYAPTLTCSTELLTDSVDNLALTQQYGHRYKWEVPLILPDPWQEYCSPVKPVMRSGRLSRCFGPKAQTSVQRGQFGRLVSLIELAYTSAYSQESA
jgi:hypothetical protein